MPDKPFAKEPLTKTTGVALVRGQFVPYQTSAADNAPKHEPWTEVSDRAVNGERSAVSRAVDYLNAPAERLPQPAAHEDPHDGDVHAARRELASSALHGSARSREQDVVVPDNVLSAVADVLVERAEEAPVSVDDIDATATALAEISVLADDQ